MTTEAESRVVHPQAKEGQGLVATPEAERKAWNRFSPSERAWPCQRLDLGRPAFRTMREYTAIVLNHSIGGTFLTAATGKKYTV